MDRLAALAMTGFSSPPLASVLRPALILGALLLALAGPRPALAHKASDSYLTLTVQGASVDGRWDIALRDLDQTIDLDTDGDGAITWGEVRERRGVIEAYALSRLTIGTEAAPCPLRPASLLVDTHSDGAYAVLRFAAACPRAPASLRVDYRLLFDLDPQHRGLLQLRAGDVAVTTILAPDRHEWRSELTLPPAGETFLAYLREGARHILGGFDHLLFLVSLVLPAVLRPGRGGWRPVDRPAEAFGDVARIVTAFTLAHSITLALTTLGWIELSPRVVQPLIAASIVLAALNNIAPLVTRGLWAVAFVFGLVHGIGFADALRDLGLPPHALALPLFAFNVGVELGQLAIVAVVLPLALAARRTRLYRSVGLRLGSLVIAGIAALWLVESAFGVALLV